jgi:hypothetical protein
MLVMRAQECIDPFPLERVVTANLFQIGTPRLGRADFASNLKNRSVVNAGGQHRLPPTANSCRLTVSAESARVFPDEMLRVFKSFAAG